MAFRQRLVLSVLLLTGSVPLATAGLLDELERIGRPERLSGQREFLPPDEAFRLIERSGEDGSLVLEFAIEPGYYLYRDRFGVTPLTPGVALGAPRLPPSESKDDPEFGVVEVYKEDFVVTVPLAEAPPGAALIETEVRYQGCAEDGICYPPIKKTVGFSPRTATPRSETNWSAAALAPSDRIARDLGERSLTVTLLSFLGLGLLLALTPCVLPMVPILSGIIVGQRQPVSTGRALSLSTTYVLAMAATYALAGIAAGLLGANLQATLQKPAVIAVFAGVFVTLALSMFGFYELQLPAALQSRLDRLSRRQASGTYLGVAAMGVLSAIIVGPCVAPPLAGALTYIGQTGSAFVGGSALFALGLGMGLPLIAVGTSAGALLPRAGPWMKRVQQFFGVIFLGVAVWFLERILPGPVTLLLWAALLLGTAVSLGALARTERSAPAATRLGQALGLACLIYGAVLIVGAGAGARDPLAPLAPFAGGGVDAGSDLAFVPVKSVADVERRLAEAVDRPVVLDFYADWCVECKHLERETFTTPAVSRRLADMTLLRADVTANDDTDRALLASYGLYGPPAVLFFRDGVEVREQRLVGFAGPRDFEVILETLVRP